MPQPAYRPAHATGVTDRILAAAEQVILGKPETLRLALTCLLARGHLLIEDHPGVGKTTLALAHPGHQRSGACRRGRRHNL